MEKQVGRPKGERMDSIKISIPKKMHDDLKDIRDKNGQAVNSTIRLAISEHLERRK